MTTSSAVSDENFVKNDIFVSVNLVTDIMNISNESIFSWMPYNLSDILWI